VKKNVEIKPLEKLPNLPNPTSQPLKLKMPKAEVDTSLLNKIALDPTRLKKVEHSVNEVSKQELQKVIDNLNRLFGIANHPYLKFQIHEATDKLMVRIMDIETKRVVRELPPEQVLDMEARIQHFVGLLIDEKI
jgi:flagellar protein FlaG